jgi:predicted DCC family thiol-disulfide oxidoreductase YuxK
VPDPTGGERAQRTVFYDAGCGVCTHVMRGMARRDRLARLTWISNRDTEALPSNVPPDLLDTTILVVDPATGRRWTRARACYEALAMLPFGRLYAWPLVVPGLSTLAGWFYDWFSRNRADISVRFGLAACEIPRRAPSTPLDTDGRSP